MRIKTKHKILTYLLCLSMILGNLLPFTTNVYGESNIIDSIGSINMEDDGVNVGIDITQDKATTYSESIESDGLQDTLVYVSQASTFGVFIPKTIVLSGQDKNANYLVRVSGNIGGTETIKVVPDKTFNLSQYGKKDIVANVSQDKIYWFHNEVDINGNGEIIANDMSAGSWNGKFNFNISLGGAITVEAKDSNGNDLQASASEITSEEKSILLENLVTSGLISSINEVNALIDVKSNEFDNFANTTFNVSSIAQEGDKIAILHFDEIKQEWEYISTETVDSEGKISANFTSFSPIAFVKINEDKNYENILLAPGLYDANGIMLCTWQESGIDAINCSNAADVIKNSYPTTRKVIMPNTITSIGWSAFKQCYDITHVVMSPNVTKISNYAFQYCYALKEINIPYGVISIDYAAFEKCTSLSSVEIPNSVKSIGGYAFWDVPHIYYYGTASGAPWRAKAMN